jgi:hypothetical protein
MTRVAPTPPRVGNIEAHFQAPNMPATPMGSPESSLRGLARRNLSAPCPVDCVTKGNVLDLLQALLVQQSIGSEGWYGLMRSLWTTILWDHR